MQPNIIKNFITKETAEYLHNYLKPKSTLNPHGLLAVFLDEYKVNTFKGDIAYDLINLLIEAIAHNFNLPKNNVTLNRMNYQVLTTGQGLGYHTDDNGAYQGTMKNSGYSVLIYLTDDYTGGEILFYNDNEGNSSKAYHPEPGTMIYFRGDENYPHSVNEVISGERANLIIFYDVKGDIDETTDNWKFYW